MKIPATLPITAEQSRAARFQLGLTQAEAINASELPGWKLKQFETGRFVPDMPFLEALRDFYRDRGIQFGDQPTARLKDQTPSNHADNQAVGQVSRMCFYVADSVEPEAVPALLERMSANDERIAALLQDRVEAGLFSAYSEDTETKVRELFGAMAENYILFRVLQDRNPLVAPKDKPQTLADLLTNTYADSPVFALVAPAQMQSEGGEQ